MKTDHSIFLTDSSDMTMLEPESVQLVVTSPPYPMIEMWDSQFISGNSGIKKSLDSQKGFHAFELMHEQLDAVWDEVYRILEPGCFACINIGDATRKIGDDFLLYPNHARILQYMVKIGFSPMPAIIWRKQTNAPNKFMGSGMLPAGAYVTLEHEYILILRKGSKRIFKKKTDKQKRRESAIFWEERNQWFSDVWFDLKGTVQKLDDKEVRKRSGAFPFSLPYRLINMFSVKGEHVVDPFLGIGTTTLAAMAAARNSTGFELEKNFMDTIVRRVENSVLSLNSIISQRIAGHEEFVFSRKEQGKALKHTNLNYGFSVVTSQERSLCLDRIDKISFDKKKNLFHVSHSNSVHSGRLPMD